MPLLEAPPVGPVEPTQAPNLFARFGEQVSNIIPELGTDAYNLLYNLGFREPNEPKPKPYNNLFNVPPPTNWKEAGVDIGAEIAKSIPIIAAGEFAGGEAAKALELGPKITKIVKAASGFGLQGATQSPRQAAEDTLLGGAFGAAEVLPMRYKAPIAALIGIGTGTEAYRTSGSATNAVAQGAVNAALPFLLKGRRVEDVDSAKTIADRTPVAPISQPSVQKPLTTTSALIRQKVAPGLSLDETLAALEKSDAEELATLQTELINRSKPTIPSPPPPTTNVEVPAPLGGPFVIGGVEYKTKEEASAAVRNVIADNKAAANQTTVNSDINPKRQPTYATILHPEDSEMIQKSAKKLGLEYGGQSEDQLLFTNPKSDNPTTFSVPVGSTHKDLRNKLAEVEQPATIVTDQPERKIATLQKQIKTKKAAIPPSPIETQAKDPTFKTEAKVMHDFGEGSELAVVEHSENGLNTLRRIDDGSLIEKIPDEKIQPLGIAKIGAVIEGDPSFATGKKEVEYVGDAHKLAQLEKENGRKTRTGNRQLESGSIDVKLLMPLAHYSAFAIGGATIGARQSDPDKKLQGAILGALGGLAAAAGIHKVYKLLTQAHPEIGKAGSTPEKLKALAEAVGHNAEQAAKASVGSAELAREAVQSGQASNYEKVARWIQQRYSMSASLKRYLQKSQGDAEDLGTIIHDAIKSLAANPLAKTPDKLVIIGNYFRGKLSQTEMISAIGDERISNTVSAAKMATESLQKMIAHSLPNGALKTAIENSFGEYLTTSYKIFHDPKYYPSAETIQKAAATLSEKLGSVEVRAKILDGYLREIKANQAMYAKGLKGYGEKFTSVLARKEDLSPEFRQMLGVYDNPIEEIAITGLKLVNAGRTASLFDYLANDIREDGLKSVYASHEYDIALESLRTQVKNTSGAEQAKLQQKLDNLEHFVWNDHNTGHGLLSGKMMDYRMKEGLATYDSVFTQFRSPWAQQMANVTNLVKYGHTVLSPFQYVRQVISLPMLGIMAKTTPMDWWKAFATLQNKSVEGLEEIRRLKKIGIFYGDVIGGMFHKDMQAMAGGRLDEILHGRVRSGLHKWEEVYRMPDLISRIAAFQREENRLLSTGVEKQLAEDKAIDYANRYAINYGAVPKGIQLARQIPFVNQYLTFAYEVARITANHFEDAIVRRDPFSIGLLTSMATAPFLLEKMTEHANLDEKGRQEWATAKELGPEYSRSNFKLIWGKDSQGRFKYTDITPIIVYDRWAKVVRDLAGGDIQATLADNPVFGWENTPLLTMAASQIGGRDIHSDQKFTPVAMGLWQNLSDRFQSARRDLFPQIIGGVEMDRIVRSFTPNEEGGLGVTNVRTGSTDNPVDLFMMYATGTRHYTVDLPVLQQRAYNTAKDQVDTLKGKLKQLYRTNVPASVKEAGKIEYESQIKKILMNLQSQLTPSSHS